MDNTIYVFRNKITGEFSSGNSSNLHKTTKDLRCARQWDTLAKARRAYNRYKNDINRNIEHYEYTIQNLLAKKSSGWATWDRMYYNNNTNYLDGAKEKMKNFKNLEIVPVKLDVQKPLPIEEVIKTKIKPTKSKPKKVSKEEDIIDGV